ncbi:MotE family protein [Jannaschia seohaensis]|uniref:Flagellar motility protein MotE (MotC chaperone) n=1 Tax=Jannaschia seohaensis TaxID=475081 RepID=A0A2Y9AU09_9RHOB|nr:hypothetical protein [Jannaschia seohaensis]PWJ17412.1 flagellar motility protein MotE (MotC chaperone) [Jannaschia seohaensis]SSA47475.1 Flagellar motility protein MotE, a chaperone for MotC folding [Jannaschia seohaensis]
MTSLISRTRRLFFAALLTVLALSALARIVSASIASMPDGTEATPSPPAPAALLCPPSSEVSDLLRAIAVRDAELEERERQVALREQDARLARQEIRASLEEMATARAALEARMFVSDSASEEDVARLVTVYEGMKPKDAAALFETMDAGFAAGFLGRMRPDAAAAIFSSLSPEQAYALSVWIAGRNANAAREGEE